MGKSVFFSEGTAGQMKSAPSFAKDDDSTLPKEPNGSKIGLGPKPIWGMSVYLNFFQRVGRMPSWILKACVQRAVGAFPAAHFWNELLKQYISQSQNFTDEKFNDRLDACRIHLEHFRSHAEPIRDRIEVIELGTGWFSVVPIGLWLCGADKVRTYDIVKHLTSARLTATLQKFVETFDDGTLMDRLPGVDAGRAKQLASLVENACRVAPEELLQRIGVEYIVEDFVRNRIPPGAIDLIISYAVFEYLHTDLIHEYFEEFRRILRPGGVMSHWIDLSDEYAYFDSKITPYNFLRFSPQSWRWINNPLIPLNRMRISDFRRVIGQAGFRIVDEKIRQGEEADLARVPLAEEFRVYPTDELLALDAWLVCMP
jgi:SAM-dependent methyltransferase